MGHYWIYVLISVVCLVVLLWACVYCSGLLCLVNEVKTVGIPATAESMVKHWTSLQKKTLSDEQTARLQKILDLKAPAMERHLETTEMLLENLQAKKWLRFWALSKSVKRQRKAFLEFLR